MENVQQILWSFWSAVISALVLSHGYYCCPVSCLLVNYQISGREGKQCFRCCVAFFFSTSWLSNELLGVILVGWPSLKRFITVPCFLCLWMKALTKVHCPPKNLETATYSIGQLLFFSFLLEFLPIRAWCIGLSICLIVRKVQFRSFLDSIALAVISYGCSQLNNMVDQS